jgi:hypothetical protein
MDRKQLEIILQLAEEKRRELDAVICSIREQLSGTIQGGTAKRHSRSTGELNVNAARIRDCLASARRLMSPADISEQLTREGASIKVAHIRNLLRRYKDELFESPAYGQWKINGRELSNVSGNHSSRNAPSNPTAPPIASKDDDDLPF